MNLHALQCILSLFQISAVLPQANLGVRVILRHCIIIFAQLWTEYEVGSSEHDIYNLYY